MRPAFSMFTFIAYYGLSLAWKEAQPAMPQTADLLWKRYHRYERKSPDPSDARRARRESAKGRTLPLDLGPTSGRNRRIFPVAGPSREGLLTEPHSSRSAVAAATGLAPYQ